jgi:hypothetical protein
MATFVGGKALRKDPREILRLDSYSIIVTTTRTMPFDPGSMRTSIVFSIGEASFAASAA